MDETLQGTYWRHIKTGGIYMVTVDNGAVLEPTQTEAVTYESLTDGNLPPQIREKALFLDGRFEQVSLAEVRQIFGMVMSYD